MHISQMMLDADQEYIYMYKSLVFACHIQLHTLNIPSTQGLISIAYFSAPLSSSSDKCQYWRTKYAHAKSLDQTFVEGGPYLCGLELEELPHSKDPSICVWLYLFFNEMLCGSPWGFPPWATRYALRSMCSWGPNTHTHTPHTHKHLISTHTALSTSKKLVWLSFAIFSNSLRRPQVSEIDL